MAMPVIVNFTLYRGDTFHREIRLRSYDPVAGTYGNYLDLTGCTPKAQVRAAPNSASPLTVELTATIPAPQSNPNLSGKIYLDLTAEQTALLDSGAAGGYDVQLTHLDGSKRTYVKGTITTDGEYTW